MRWDAKKGKWVSNDRLDKIDLVKKLIYKNIGDPHLYIYAHGLLKCIHNYWYWGLGQNGCTDQKWQDAYDYLFVARSTDPSSWGPRVYEELINHEWRRVVLSDEEMRLRCFDVHFSWLNMSVVVPFEGFLRMLKEKRREILTVNREQVEEYLVSEQAKTIEALPDGTHILLKYKTPDLIRIMTEPASVEELEELWAVRVLRPDPPRPCRTFLSASRNRTHGKRKRFGEEQGMLCETSVGGAADHLSQRLA